MGLGPGARTPRLARVVPSTFGCGWFRSPRPRWSSRSSRDSFAGVAATRRLDRRRNSPERSPTRPSPSPRSARSSPSERTRPRSSSTPSPPRSPARRPSRGSARAGTATRDASPSAPDSSTTPSSPRSRDSPPRRWSSSVRVSTPARGVSPPQRHAQSPSRVRARRPGGARSQNARVRRDRLRLRKPPSDARGTPRRGPRQRRATRMAPRAPRRGPRPVRSHDLDPRGFVVLPVPGRRRSSPSRRGARLRRRVRARGVGGEQSVVGASDPEGGYRRQSDPEGRYRRQSDVGELDGRPGRVVRRRGVDDDDRRATRETRASFGRWRGEPPKPRGAEGEGEAQTPRTFYAVCRLVGEQTREGRERTARNAKEGA